MILKKKLELHPGKVDALVTTIDDTRNNLCPVDSVEVTVRLPTAKKIRKKVLLGDSLVFSYDCVVSHRMPVSGLSSWKSV